MIKIGLVGASVRVGAFVEALKKDYGATHQIVGVFDIDPGKLRGFCTIHRLNVPQFTNFDSMCDATSPDLVIVSTVDTTHAQYIGSALDRKIGVISEKPLCINAEQCREILAAHRRNPEVFAATAHNSRYRPVARTLKKLLESGIVGRVIRLEYSELLDLRHGKSYFRRWNSRRAFSNGLELHKSTHHFDKMNYLLNSRAAEVTGMGTLSCYGAKAPHRFEGTCCHECPHQQECPDFADYDRELFQSEIYTPDLCIYSPEIDIEDDYSGVIRFKNGVLAAYSVTAHAQYEGEIIIIEGERGRLEARQIFFRNIGEKSDDHDSSVIPEETILLYRFGQGEPEKIEVKQCEGCHGGADRALFAELFSVPPSPTLPTLEDGVQAVLTGAALVTSIQTGNKIDVQSQLL